MTPEELRKRHSVRRYSNKEIDLEIINKLKADLTYINTHAAGLHFTLVTDDPAPFEGFSASYGMFNGVRYFVACIVDSSFSDVSISAGYYAEQFVMYAVELGLSTCFVGGTFNRNAVNLPLRAGWKIPFVITIGYADETKKLSISGIAEKIMHRKSKSAKDFIYPKSGKVISMIDDCKWLSQGLEGLASAPSALNRQPVKINIDEQGNITGYVEKSTPDFLIDLGIGLWNFESASGGYWQLGNPAIFTPPHPIDNQA